MSSKLIQMCATLFGRRHLVNAYEMHAEWLIPFVDKRVRGRKNCVNPVPSSHVSGRWSLLILSGV